MDVGLLVLRLVVGALLAGHAVQKLFGWFSGAGPAATGALFEAWGHRPGRAMAVLAGLSEAAGGTLLAAGLLVPLATAITAGTMLVACVAVAPRGFWAARGGYELPFLYALIAISIGFTGAGRWSADRTLGFDLDGAGWGLAAAGAALVAGTAVLARRRLPRAEIPTGTAATAHAAGRHD